MLDEKDVDHIAKLARIELSDAMREKMKNDLTSILDYIEMLSSVPTENVEPLYQVTGLTDRLRHDEHRGDFPMDETLDARLTGQAPMKSDRLVKVKGVLKK
jgi:aspartyl-tRNA(Asn)/glutamyl-tRNA(Gln) amidotransferase subunit C